MTTPQIIITIRGANIETIHANKTARDLKIRVIDYDLIENCTTDEEAREQERQWAEVEQDRDSPEYIMIY